MLIRVLLSLTLLLMTAAATSAQSAFKTSQLRFERVRQAYAEKWPGLAAELKKAGLSGKFQLYLAAYKHEGKLEVWVKTAGGPKYELFKTYDFCAHSGTLGPKLVEGDGQTPEGFYTIAVFNPQSSFHLSLGINFPNAVDRARTGPGRSPGSDIYIHGSCVTVGCIPLTDDKVKEVYVLAVEARQSGQLQIPVAIYPFRMTTANLQRFGARFPAHLAFWQSLRPAYDHFSRLATVPPLRTSAGGYSLAR